jgi:hypothetical protein
VAPHPCRPDRFVPVRTRSVLLAEHFDGVSLIRALERPVEGHSRSGRCIQTSAAPYPVAVVSRAGEPRHGEVAAEKHRLVCHEADPKIREPRFRLALLVFGDENVLRFHVLMKDADRMGSGQRVGNLRDEQETDVERDQSHAARGFRPLREIAAVRVFRFEEERRLVEVPVQHLCNVVSFPELLFQDAEECRLALEAAHARGIEAELEPRRSPDEWAASQTSPKPPSPNFSRNVQPSRSGTGRQGAGRQPSVTSSPGRTARRAPFVSAGRALPAYFEDIEGFADAVEQIRAVRKPHEAIISPVATGTSEIESGAREQHLSRFGKAAAASPA